MTEIYGKSLPVPAPYADICDFYVHIRADRPIRLLQLSDMQLIDASQQRYPERLNANEIRDWCPENIDVLCLDHIRSLAAQTAPDLIFITGDVIYGEFDDSGRSFDLFCSFMDSLQIPWAPVFGNHDNESHRGTAWQCERFAQSTYCLFARGNVSGNGNYSVLISHNGTPERILCMLDSHGCGGAHDPEDRIPPCICEDQVAWLSRTATALRDVLGYTLPAFAAFHIPSREFHLSMEEKGYFEGGPFYVLGVDVAGKDGDFGCCHEHFGWCHTPDGFCDTLSAAGVNGVFAGHNHMINTSILYGGIRWTFSLKTGQYDYHAPGQLGGTLVTLDPAAVCGHSVTHIPALVIYGPFPNAPRNL